MAAGEIKGWGLGKLEGGTIHKNRLAIRVKRILSTSIDMETLGGESM